MLRHALSPVASLLFALAALALPAILIESLLPGHRRSVSRVVSVVLAFAAAYGILSATAFLVLLRPQVQGADFFYFLCVARDTLDGVPVTELSYSYFPGSYAFWRFALRIGHRDLGVAQWMYVLVLAGNAAGLGVAVRRVASSVVLGFLAAIAYVAASSRLEGGFGIAEPIGTLPLVLAVAAWAGEPLRERRGRLLAAALGVGIGLAAFVKQQAGLQAAGWVALPLLNPFLERDRRHELRALLLVPAAAALAFVLGVLSEGHGFMPIRAGLSIVGGYETHASFVDNLTNAFGRVLPLVLASAVSVLAAPYLVLRRRPGDDRALNVFGFGLAAAAATLLQFTKRGYAHYALITLPWLVVVALVGLAISSARLPARVRDLASTKLVWLGLAAVSFVRPEVPNRQALSLWPPTTSVAPPDLRHRWLQQDMQGDIASARKLVHPGEDVLVLPPRHNEIHFFLGTRSLSFAEHYAWGGVHTKNAPRALASKTLAAVVVVKPRGDTDQQAWRNHDCDETVAALEKNGFHKAAALRTLSVWRRN